MSRPVNNYVSTQFVRLVHDLRTVAENADECLMRNTRNTTTCGANETVAYSLREQAKRLRDMADESEAVASALSEDV